MNLLTPPGIAGIAVLRATTEERSRLVAMLRGANGATPVLRPGAAPRRASLCVGDATVDDVLVVDRGPAGLEIHLHGAPAILEALRTVFVIDHAAPRSAAERLLWQAMSRGQLQLAVEQMAFDVDEFLRDLATLPRQQRRERIDAALARSRIALAHVEPLRLVLVGSQNAGKSSLLNALVLRERVLAGPVPGLTRDPVAETAVLDGYPVEIVDTAGEGPTPSAADARALAMARAVRDGATTLLVVDSSVGPTDVDRRLAASAALVIANKNDLPAAPWPDDLRPDLVVSCRSDEPGRLRRDIGRLLRERRGLPPSGAVGGFAAMSRADVERIRAAAVGLPA